MQKNLKTLIVPLLAAATLTTTLPASGIEQELVPSEVEWLLHIDVDTPLKVIPVP